MMLEKLLADLVRKFPEQQCRIEKEPTPRLVIPPKYVEFGEIEITQEGDELILVAGKFTHSHFACYAERVSADEKVMDIIDNVADFLSATFADQVIFWGGHRQTGGWYRIDLDGDSQLRTDNGDQFLWSKPVRP
jgi:hypothetical protein